ncbi:MAG: class I SAM-dependent methyltransferase [Williamsia herbipolensis]|nr:class I SAM-dependent methyltransferase [Williamsia herbipolensis]
MTSAVPRGDQGAAGYAVNAQYYAAIFPPDHRDAVVRGLRAVLPGTGSIVEIGCGTGLFTVELLEHLGPGAELFALEPSPVMRAAATTRLVDHPRAERVTVIPGDALSAPLPDDLAEVGAVVLLHVLTHLAPAERISVWRRHVPMLRAGGVLVVDPQWPQEPQDVPVDRWQGRRLGRYRYDTEAAARTSGPGVVDWTMTYRTVDDRDRLVDEQTVTFPSHVVSRTTLDAELAGHGLVAVEGIDEVWAWRRAR